MNALFQCIEEALVMIAINNLRRYRRAICEPCCSDGVPHCFGQPSNPETNVAVCAAVQPGFWGPGVHKCGGAYIAVPDREQIMGRGIDQMRRQVAPCARIVSDTDHFNGWIDACLKVLEGNSLGPNFPGRQAFCCGPNFTTLIGVLS